MQIQTTTIQTTTMKQSMNRYMYRAKHSDDDATVETENDSLLDTSSTRYEREPNAFSSFVPPSLQRDGETPLYQACRWGHYTTALTLLIKGDDVNQADCSDDHGATPLHAALIHERANIVNLLLAHGADVNRSANNGWTPLHIAASTNGNTDIVQLLLDHDAQLNATDARGWTALFVASFRGHIEVVRLLLSKESTDVNATDVHGQTPLMTASQRGHREIVNLLLQHGANAHAADEDGATALDFEACYQDEVVQVLLARKVQTARSRLRSRFWRFNAYRR
jgi:ankyrin repeat protein